MINELKKAGADVNARDKYGRTALMYATRFNQNPLVTIALLEAGANAKAADNSGKMAVHYAQDNEKLKGNDAYRKLQEASQ